jgi:hypothetical protein
VSWGSASPEQRTEWSHSDCDDATAHTVVDVFNDEVNWGRRKAKAKTNTKSKTKTKKKKKKTTRESKRSASRSDEDEDVDNDE